MAPIRFVDFSPRHSDDYPRSIRTKRGSFDGSLRRTDYAAMSIVLRLQGLVHGLECRRAAAPGGAVTDEVIFHIPLSKCRSMPMGARKRGNVFKVLGSGVERHRW